MKIGTRITLPTITLVMLTLGLYAWVSLRNRRGELATDQERQLTLVGRTISVALEDALERGSVQDVSPLIERWQAEEPSIGFTYIDLQNMVPGKQPPGFAVAENPPDAAAAPWVPPPPDPTRAQRIQRVTIDGRPYGEHVTVNARPVFALTIPIRDKYEKIVGAVDLTRDESAVAIALADSAQDAAVALVVLGLMLAVLVYLVARSAISNPLERLVEAIDDVTHGDLGRVILRERDDEVGDLAERFNEMTGSLREAREEILAGVDAKLALEARLRHSEKLATIGQLAAGIAHEVGTPLNVIGGRARTMEKKAGDPAEVAKNAGIIAAQTQRITRIIQQLLDYARRPVAARGRVDLQKTAKDCLDFLEHQMATSRVEPKLHPFRADIQGGPQTPHVIGDSDQLQQVTLNLCVNAIQAMTGGGVLELGTRGIERRRPGLDTAAPGPYVVLELSDTGPGIPAEDREKIFEPFYSTKEGTGLGLAVSVGIVKDHDGWMEIDDRPGGGTVFRVFLPAEQT